MSLSFVKNWMWTQPYTHTHTHNHERFLMWVHFLQPEESPCFWDWGSLQICTTPPLIDMQRPLTRQLAGVTSLCWKAGRRTSKQRGSEAGSTVFSSWYEASLPQNSLQSCDIFIPEAVNHGIADRWEAGIEKGHRHVLLGECFQSRGVCRSRHQPPEESNTDMQKERVLKAFLQLLAEFWLTKHMEVYRDSLHVFYIKLHVS